MHLWAISTVIIAVMILRYCSPLPTGNWYERWYKNLFLLLFPALLIFSTAIAVLLMGCHGAMLGVKAGSWGCAVAISILIFAVVCLVKLIYQSRRAISNLDNYPTEKIGEVSAKIVDLDLPYTAQIGFWQPELVVSRGSIASLDREHLDAAIAHELAHVYYRDTFWFFWLGWLRSVTFWLPHTETLWQELLLLREIRADRKATETVDFLILAESLLAVVQTPGTSSSICTANFNDRNLGDRLNERIDFLLGEAILANNHSWLNWSWIWLSFVPLLSLPLHY